MSMFGDVIMMVETEESPDRNIAALEFNVAISEFVYSLVVIAPLRRGEDVSVSIAMTNHGDDRTNIGT